MITGNEGTDSNGQSPTPEYSGQVAWVDFVESSCESSEVDDDLATDGPSLTVASLGNQTSCNFGNIVVAKSRDVHFGNQTIYQGPVTIRQIVYASNGDPHIDQDVLPGLETAPAVETERTDVTLKTSESSRIDSNVDYGLFQATEGFDGHEKETFHQPKCRLRRRHIALITTGGVVAILTVATLIALTSKATDTIALEPSSRSGELRIWQRSDWHARNDTEGEVLLKHPLPYVIIIHTVSRSCFSLATCAPLIRDAQDLHISYYWGDIGYSFLVGGDGYAYVGRGWNYQGAHTFRYNICSIGIAFIGTFTTEQPTQQQMEAAELLMAEGVRLGVLRPDYRLIGHRQAIETVSPGDALFADLKKLPHFSHKALTCGEVVQDMDREMRI